MFHSTALNRCFSGEILIEVEKRKKTFSWKTKSRKKSTSLWKIEYLQDLNREIILLEKIDYKQKYYKE